MQVFSNFPLTDDQAARLRAGVPADGYELLGTASAPSAHVPTVGAPSPRVVGGLLPADEELGKNESHPPTEASPGEDEGEGEWAGPEEASGEAAEEPSGGPEVAVAERVLLSSATSSVNCISVCARPVPSPDSPPRARLRRSRPRRHRP